MLKSNFCYFFSLAGERWYLILTSHILFPDLLDLSQITKKEEKNENSLPSQSAFLQEEKNECEMDFSFRGEKNNIICNVCMAIKWYPVVIFYHRNSG